MSNLNKALLIGRLTKDPEMRYTPSGTAVTNFSIATNRWSTGPDGERKEFTDYHNIVAYPIGKRNLAETVAQYTRKGALVFVEGRIQTRSWEGQDGQKRRVTEIIANDVQSSSRVARVRASAPALQRRHERRPRTKTFPRRTTPLAASTRTKSLFRSHRWQSTVHNVNPAEAGRGGRSGSTGRGAASAWRKSSTATTRRSRGCAVSSATAGRSCPVE